MNNKTHLKNTNEAVAEQTKPALQLYLVCPGLQNGNDTAILYGQQACISFTLEY